MHAKLVWFLGFGNPTGKRFDPERSQMHCLAGVSRARFAKAAG